MFRALLEASAFAVRHNLEPLHAAGATISSLRGSGGGASRTLWPQIVSDVTGLTQEVRKGPEQASRGAALLAAMSIGAATLDTEWLQPALQVVPHEEARPLYDELYGRFRELTQATQTHAHALAAWQRERREPGAKRGPQAERDGRPD